jgi:hypothetical protein
MKLQEHPEYPLYQQASTLAQRCRQAVADWQAGGQSLYVPEYDWRWTPDLAQSFVQELIRFFAAYNRVLWQQFPYCSGCRGGCCVLHATQVTWFDGLALALLDQSLPLLPASIQTTSRGCVYLSAGGCSWPQSWKPVKCALFYCALGDSPALITAALLQIFDRHLPEPLQRYEAVDGRRLADSAADPVLLAVAFHRALHNIFANPFLARYLPQAVPDQPDGPAVEKPGRAVLDSVIDETSLFLTQAMDEIGALPLAADQILADLETLEWLLQGRPGQAQALLAKLYQRYAGAPPPEPGRPPLLEYRMRQHLLQLWQNWP